MVGLLSHGAHVTLILNAFLLFSLFHAVYIQPLTFSVQMSQIWNCLLASLAFDSIFFLLLIFRYPDLVTYQTIYIETNPFS